MSYLESYLASLSDLHYDDGGIWQSHEDELDGVRTIMAPFPSKLGDKYYPLSYSKESGAKKTRVRLKLISASAPALLPRFADIRVLVKGALWNDWTIPASDAGLSLRWRVPQSDERPSVGKPESDDRPKGLPYDEASERLITALHSSAVVTGNITRLLSLLPPHYAWDPETWASIIQDTKARLDAAQAQRIPRGVWTASHVMWKGRLTGNTLSSYLASGYLPPSIWAWTRSLPEKSLRISVDGHDVIRVRVFPAVASITTDVNHLIAQELRRLKHRFHYMALTAWTELDILITSRLIQLINSDASWITFRRHQLGAMSPSVCNVLPFVSNDQIRWVSERDFAADDGVLDVDEVAPRRPKFIHTNPYVIALEPWCFFRHAPVVSSTATLYSPKEVQKPVETLFATLTSPLWVPSVRQRLLSTHVHEIAPDRVDDDIIDVYLRWQMILESANLPLVLHYGFPSGTKPKKTRKTSTILQDILSGLPWRISKDFLRNISLI